MLVDAAAGTADVVVLPNDDDHEAVAQAAALEIRTTGRRVAIIPTHSVVQGVAAVAVHDPTRSFTDDVVAMTAAAGATRHGGVAQAEREAMTSAGICRPGEILGLVEGDIALIGADPLSVGCQLVDRMLSAGGEIVTLMWGSDPFDGRELADGVREHLHSARRDVEVTIYNGGQPHYPLLIGVE
jgi:dihydroxyacetone kinase-like predicted kinase